MCAWALHDAGSVLPPEQIAGDVFDMLLSFGDFDEFKALMLSYKSQAAFEAGAFLATCRLRALCHAAPAVLAFLTCTRSCPT